MYRVLTHRHDLRLSGVEEGGLTFQVKRIVSHENFETQPGSCYDIAIVFFDNDEPFPFALPLLPTQSPRENKEVNIAGWGRLDASVPGGAPVLQKLVTSVLSFEKCVDIYEKFYGRQIVLGQLCTSRGNASPSLGDSGGPMYYWDPELENHVILGLVSSGRPSRPTVHTDVRVYRQWIEETVRKNNERSLIEDMNRSRNLQISMH